MVFSASGAQLAFLTKLTAAVPLKRDTTTTRYLVSKTAKKEMDLKDQKQRRREKDIRTNRAFFILDRPFFTRGGFLEARVALLSLAAGSPFGGGCIGERRT